VSVKLTKGKRASDADIERLEKSLGGKMPDAVAAFFRQYDGDFGDSAFNCQLRRIGAAETETPDIY